VNWASWSDFFSMGGYAIYVWGSYGVATGLIVVEIILLRNRRRAALEQLGRSGTGGRA
jgi:heme exporter protein D